MALMKHVFSILNRSSYVSFNPRLSFLRINRLCTQSSSEGHIPVMINEVTDALNIQSGQTIMDMTFGAGGHSKQILEKAENIRIIAVDRDPLAHSYAVKLAEQYPEQIIPLLGRFSEIPALLKCNSIDQNSIDGMLFDFGCSSMQLDQENRGFSLSKNGPLDMRMDANRIENQLTAADVIALADEEDLYKIIKYYGEEKNAKKIARALVQARYLFKRLKTTQELADLVASVSEDEIRFDKIQRRSHPATKTFQAFRIFVNNELNEINYGLLIAQKYIKLGGRIVALTFHSLEDTIVKRHLFGNLIENSANPLPLKYSSHNVSIDKSVMEEVFESNWKSLYKRVLVPKYEEVESNPRSRSAKLRAAIRIK